MSQICEGELIPEVTEWGPRVSLTGWNAGSKTIQYNWTGPNVKSGIYVQKTNGKNIEWERFPWQEITWKISDALKWPPAQRKLTVCAMRSLAIQHNMKWKNEQKSGVLGKECSHYILGQMTSRVSCAILGTRFWEAHWQIRVYSEMGCLRWRKSQKFFDVRRSCKIRKQSA